MRNHFNLTFAEIKVALWFVYKRKYEKVELSFQIPALVMLSSKGMSQILDYSCVNFVTICIRYLIKYIYMKELEYLPGTEALESWYLYAFN